MTDQAKQYQFLVLAINFRQQRGLCRGVHLYNLICYPVGQLLQQSLQWSLCQPRPQPPASSSPPQVLLGQLHHFNNSRPSGMTIKVVFYCTTAPSVTLFLLHRLSPLTSYITSHIEIYFPAASKNVWTSHNFVIRPWLQLLAGWRASRAPVNHRLLYLGHSKSSCVMQCYLSSK